MAAEAETNSKPRVDQAIKLLARILDPECPVPEAQNAAGKLIVIARMDGVTLEAIANAINPKARPRHRVSSPPPEPHDIIIRFGKFKGRTLGFIARENLSYLEWLSTDFDGPRLRKAARAVLDSLTGAA